MKKRQNKIQKYYTYKKILIHERQTSTKQGLMLYSFFFSLCTYKGSCNKKKNMKINKEKTTGGC